jgi:hypothetical protein
MRGRETMGDRLYPNKFRLGMGGYLGDGFELVWNGSALDYRLFDRRFSSRASGTVAPSVDEWRRFWQWLDRHDLWSWPETCENDCPSPNATSWSVHIECNDRILRSSGADAYPGGATGAPSQVFIGFLGAVRNLLGGLELLRGDPSSP